MRDSLLRIVSLIRKEVLALLRDPRSRVILFLPPLLQSFLFGYAATFDLNHAPYAVYDETAAPPPPTFWRASMAPACSSASPRSNARWISARSIDTRAALAIASIRISSATSPPASRRRPDHR